MERVKKVGNIVHDQIIKTVADLKKQFTELATEKLKLSRDKDPANVVIVKENPKKLNEEEVIPLYPIPDIDADRGLRLAAAISNIVLIADGFIQEIEAKGLRRTLGLLKSFGPYAETKPEDFHTITDPDAKRLATLLHTIKQLQEVMYQYSDIDFADENDRPDPKRKARDYFPKATDEATVQGYRALYGPIKALTDLSPKDRQKIFVAQHWLIPESLVNFIAKRAMEFDTEEEENAFATVKALGDVALLETEADIIRILDETSIEVQEVKLGKDASIASVKPGRKSEITPLQILDITIQEKVSEKEDLLKKHKVSTDELDQIIISHDLIHQYFIPVLADKDFKFNTNIPEWLAQDESLRIEYKRKFGKDLSVCVVNPSAFQATDTQLIQLNADQKEAFYKQLCLKLN